MTEKLVLLAFAIKGAADTEHKKIIDELIKKYDIPRIYDIITTHITIKTPLRVTTEKLLDLKKVIKNFCDSNKKVAGSFKGFDHFDDKVIFAKIDMPKNFFNLHKDLIKKLSELSWMVFHKFDHDWKPHATIIHKKIKGKFEKIWNEVKDKPFNHKIVIDTITIFNYKNNKWNVLEEFPLR